MAKTPRSTILAYILVGITTTALAVGSWFGVKDFRKTQNPTEDNRQAQVQIISKEVNSRDKLIELKERAYSIMRVAEATPVANNAKRVQLLNQAKDLEKEFLRVKSDIPNVHIIRSDILDETELAIKNLKDEFNLKKKISRTGVTKTKKEPPKVEPEKNKIFKRGDVIVDVENEYKNSYTQFNNLLLELSNLEQNMQDAADEYLQNKRQIEKTDMMDGENVSKEDKDLLILQEKQIVDKKRGDFKKRTNELAQKFFKLRDYLGRAQLTIFLNQFGSESSKLKSLLNLRDKCEKKVADLIKKSR